MRKRTYIYIYIYVYYTYNRVAWLYSRNWPSIVNQLDFNKKKYVQTTKNLLWTPVHLNP